MITCQICQKEFSIRSFSKHIKTFHRYEHFALNFLLTEYKEDEIIKNVNQMPKIWYQMDGKNKKYYPDIYIYQKKT